MFVVAIILDIEITASSYQLQILMGNLFNFFAVLLYLRDKFENSTLLPCPCFQMWKIFDVNRSHSSTYRQQRRRKWTILIWWLQGGWLDNTSMVSLLGSRMSLLGFRVSLCSPRVSLHGYRLSLNISKVNPHSSIASLYGTRVSLHGSRAKKLYHQKRK